MISFKIYPKTFKCKKPITIRSQTYSARECLYIEMISEGRTFLSECSPLPKYHPYTLAQETEFLNKFIAENKLATLNIENFNVTLPFFGLITAYPLGPCGLFAIEHLLYQYLREYFSEHADKLIQLKEGANEILVHDLIIVSSQNTNVVPDNKFLKCKVGYQTIDEDIVFFKNLLVKRPQTKLILDANERYSSEDFLKLYKQFEEMIVYIEDCPEKNLIPESKKAWDTPTFLKDMSVINDDNHLVLKPTLFQGLSGLLTFLKNYSLNSKSLSSCYELGPLFNLYLDLRNSEYFINENFDQSTWGFGTVDYICDESFLSGKKKLTLKKTPHI